MGKQMVLAQYTIRSKQDYIFRTNRINEIVGASKLIAEVWDDLFRIASENGIRVSRESAGKFVLDVNSEIAGETVIELFCGGGNLTVLYDDRKTYTKLNKLFSFYVMKERPGMIPMAVCTDVTGDYRKDYASLMAESEIEKNRMNPARDSFILPFSKMDRNTFIPVAGEKFNFSANTEMSYACAVKAKRGTELRDDNVKMLDDMITKKGQESLLAVIHADGNNMGKKIMSFLGDDSDYASCVGKMREFTSKTARAFADNGKTALAKCRNTLMEKYKKFPERSFAYREIVADGDDFTFICNARFAMEYTRAYLEEVDKFVECDWKYSSCAGICIFHSHYPFAKAYSLAEQACDDGAKKMVHVGGDESPEECWVDFHYIHSGIGGDLSVIRKMQRTENVMARPWLVAGRASNPRKLDNLDLLYKELKNNNVTRTVIKEIGQAWESSKPAGRQVYARMIGCKTDIKENLEKIVGGNVDDLLKALYDLSEVIDLWYEEV